MSRMIEPPGIRVSALLQPTDDGDATLDSASVSRSLARLAQLPKVELHLHLEGALRLDTVCELARRREPSSPLCSADWAAQHWTFRNLSEFVLELGTVVRIALREADDYRRAAHEAFDDLAVQGVRYAEVNVSPRLPSHPYYVPVDEMLAAVEQARRRVEAKSSLRLGLILGMNRTRVAAEATEPGQVAVRLVRAGLDARERGVGLVGIDLVGDEQAAPDIRPLIPAFRLAYEAGLGLRAHAGEGDGARAVREAVDVLRVQRVGHGVRAIEDPALVEHLAQVGAVLDVCPTSNILTGAVASLDRHPLRHLYDAGVPVTISSDDPLAFHTSVTAELALLYHRLGFAPAELAEMAVAAAKHSFLPEHARLQLTSELQAEWTNLAEKIAG